MVMLASFKLVKALIVFINKYFSISFVIIQANFMLNVIKLYFIKELKVIPLIILVKEVPFKQLVLIFLILVYKYQTINEVK